MVLLVVALPDLAVEISQVVSNANYLLSVGGADGTELRHQVHCHQPDIIILDYRVGGSGWRAIDEVPAIVSRTTTHPHVIAVLPSVSRKIETTAAHRQCWDVISVRGANFHHDLRDALHAAAIDRQEHAPALKRVCRDDLH